MTQQDIICFCQKKFDKSRIKYIIEFMIDLKLNVLVAEDNNDFRSVIVDYFEGKGIKTVEAANGLKAYEIFKRHNINCVIADWNMPGLTGLELLKKIRFDKNVDFNSIAFMIMTSISEKDKIIKASKAEVDDYILKPFRIQIFEERFEKLIFKKLPHQYFALCFKEIEKNRYEQAFKKFEFAYLNESMDPLVFCGLIISSLELNKIDCAKKYYDECFYVAADSEDPIFLYTCALYNEMQNDIKKAIELYNQSIKINPVFIRSYIKLAQIYFKMKEYKEAKNILNKIDDTNVKSIHDLTRIKELYQNISENSDILCNEQVARYIMLINSCSS